MPAQSTSIKLPTLAGGVAKTAPTKRRPDQVEEADNVFLSLERGCEKRQATDFISADGIAGSLDIAELPANDDDIVFNTFRMQKNKAVIIVVIPSASNANAIQFFDATTGAKLEVPDFDEAGDMASFRAYLQQGTSPLSDRLRFTRVKDSVLILNTEVEAKFLNTGVGAPLSYSAPHAISSADGNQFPDGTTDLSGTLAKNTIGLDESGFSGGTYAMSFKDSEFRDRQAALANATIVDFQNSISVQSMLEVGEGPDGPRFLITTQEGQDADHQAQWPVLRTPFVRNTDAVRAAMVALHGRDTQSVNYVIGGVNYSEAPSNIMGYQLLGSPALGDGFIFNIRESVPGAPSGFYRTISTSEGNTLPEFTAETANEEDPANRVAFNYFDRTHEHSTSYVMENFTPGAPYYQRIRTEGKGSVLDATTLPYIIAFNSNADAPDFRLSEGPWAPRLNGDSSNNPGPSFLANTPYPYSTQDDGQLGSRTGARITAMGYWRNRLWLASGTTIVSSQAGDPYNLFIDDADVLSEFDPIDLSVNESDASRIQWVVPFEAALFLGTDGSEQFSLTGSDNFVSPTTASLDSTSEYSLSSEAEPLKVGNNLFFTDEGRLFAYVGQGRGLNASFSISENVLGYFPSSVAQAITAPASDLVLFRSNDAGEDNQVYVYQQRAMPNGQIGQAAFYRWSFLDPIHHISVLGNDLIQVSKRNNLFYLESMNMNAVDVSDTLLDRRVTLTSSDMTFVTNEGVTRMSLPYLAANPVLIDSVTHQVVAVRSSSEVDNNGNTVIDIAGDVTSQTFIAGEAFEMSITLSPFVLRDGNNTHIDAGLQLKDLATRHYKSGSYEIAVTRRGRLETAATFDPFRTTNPFVTDGDAYFQLNGQAQARLAGNADDITIVLRSSGHVPVNITNVEARVSANIGRDSAIE